MPHPLSSRTTPTFAENRVESKMSSVQTQPHFQQKCSECENLAEVKSDQLLRPFHHVYSSRTLAFLSSLPHSRNFSLQQQFSLGILQLAPSGKFFFWTRHQSITAFCARQHLHIRWKSVCLLKRGSNALFFFLMRMSSCIDLNVC